LDTKVLPHSSPSRAGEPRSHNPKSFKARRWSAQVGISRSWRIGAIPLRSIAVGFKTLASRVAQAVTRPSAARRTNESEERQTVRVHSPDRKAVGACGTQAAGKKVIQQLEMALKKNLIEMVCDPTTETVDAAGICKAFEKDAPRGIHIIDTVASPAQDLQVGPHAPHSLLPAPQPAGPNVEEQPDPPQVVIAKYMRNLGKNRFANNTAIMEAFTKLVHQGAFAPVMEKMGALLGECTFSTPVAEAPLVSLLSTTQRFELHASTVTSDTARLEVSMHLNASIHVIAGQTDSQKTFDPDTSEVSFSSRVILEIDCRQVLPPPSSDPKTDKKSTEPKGSLSGDTSGEQRYPSRLQRAAITLTMADTRVEYRLNPK
jgi:hypothetical protein